eukprot:scaffold2084_cov53-Cylindrotheca_fusiformis.AAC.1
MTYLDTVDSCNITHGTAGQQMLKSMAKFMGQGLHLTEGHERWGITDWRRTVASQVRYGNVA